MTWALWDCQKKLNCQIQFKLLVLPQNQWERNGEGELGIVSGSGDTYDGSGQSHDLMYADMKIFKISKCEALFKKNILTLLCVPRVNLMVDRVKVILVVHYSHG